MGLYVGGARRDPRKRRHYKEGVAPGTPAPGRGYLYEKPDGIPYFKNDAGTEYDLTNIVVGGSVTHTTNATLTSADFGKLIIMNSASNLICTLMSISATDIDKNLTIVRLGTGELRVQAVDSDTVGPSSVGGYLKSAETRTAPCISIGVVSATHWTFFRYGSYGIWLVY